MEQKPLQLPQIEKEILTFWEKEGIFDKVVKAHEKDEPFVFYDGPPFATGLPHHGHILQMAIKDAVIRYKTMQGYNVPRKIGWDTHGLPVEYQLEKELNISGKKQIEAYGIDKFVEAARGIVLRYTAEWKKTMERMGRWVDVAHPYTTMDNDYIESVWWAFSELHKKELIYKDFRVSPYCPRCGTVLANFEVNQGYKDNTPDPSVYVAVKITGDAPTALEDAHLLLWTTTPWTLPANVAAAVNVDEQYAVVSHEGQKYVVAESLVKNIFGESAAGDQVLNGSELLGITYEPLYNVSKNDGAYRVVAGHHVTTDDGTGIVHMAPSYGEDDYVIARSENLITPLLQTVDPDGKVKMGLGIPGEGKFVKTADKEIMADLQEKGVLFKEQPIKHTYPFCWRCDTPLLYFPVTSWYVRVASIKDQLVAENKKIHWQPAHLRDGRFGNWLEGSPDWAISRDRYWGAPLPVWECTKCERVTIVSSRDELKDKAADPLTVPNDLHRPYIDAVTMTCACGGEVKRVPFVFDCWFESGSMPFAQHHYPFENKEAFDAVAGKGYPADFIAEALDQTRGWFYVLHVLGVALWGKRAFKNVDVSGLLLAKDGRKLSKSLRNYTEPEIVMEEQGVDALRLFLFTATTLGEDYRLSDEAVNDVKRRWIVPLLNVVQYYKQSLADQDPAQSTSDSHAALDAWIQARTNEAERTIAAAMTGDEENPYDLVRACRTFGPLVEDLSTWYVRLSRGRTDAAFTTTLRKQLGHIARMYAPFLPFVMEYIYQELRDQTDAQSVHILMRHGADAIGNKEEEATQLHLMKEVRDIVSVGREQRNKNQLPLKQPLAKVTIYAEKPLDAAYGELIKQELQVKEVAFQSENEDKKLDFDVTVTSELKAEGEANVLRRTIQDLRKQAQLQPKDAAAVFVTNLADNVKPFLNDQLSKTTLLDAASDAEILGEADAADTHITLYRG
jgi:isoleucyl-tRNA synthetase